MASTLIYPVGSTAACRYAAEYLAKDGFPIIDHPAPEVTHLLLDAPSFDTNGMLRNGSPPERLLEMLPQYITVIGGNLSHPALDGFRQWDLLADDMYLAQNARITAECVLATAAPLLPVTLSQSPVLIIGWGRIGKCLGQLLRAIGNPVTIAARKSSDRAMAAALGYSTVSPELIHDLRPYRLLINTAPGSVLEESAIAGWQECVKIDLASKKGLLGDGVVWARGLPGICAPESSGHLIADTVFRLLKEDRP